MSFERSDEPMPKSNWAKASAPNSEVRLELT